MVVLINNNKDLDQQDQYSRAWFLVAMVAFKGLMEATISNFTLSIVQLELTYESLLPKKNWCLNHCHCQKNHANLEANDHCLEPKTFLLSK